MRRTTAVRSVLLSTLVLTAAGAVGCSKASQYRMNPSPNTSNLEWSSNEIDNRITVTNDTNLRNVSNDFGRFWLLDKPSSLSRTSMPY